MTKKSIDEVMAETLAVLKEGGVILYPTDTVWGLGCDATNPDAVARIFSIKQREDSKSLVLLAASLDQVGLYVKEIPPMAILKLRSCSSNLVSYMKFQALIEVMLSIASEDSSFCAEAAGDTTKDRAKAQKNEADNRR